MKNNSLKLLIVGIVLLLALPTLALSATSGPFVTTTPIPYTLTDWTSSLSFPKFNSALGTLTMVQLDLSGTIKTVITVVNDSPESSVGLAKTECQLSVQDAGNNFTVPQIDLFSPVFNYNLAGGGSITSGTLTKSGSSSTQYTAAAILAEFNGPGTIVLPASTFTQTLLGNTGGNTFAAQVTNAQLTGNVTYFYDPPVVPEASSIMLGLMGLSSIGGFGLLRRRK